MNKTVSSPQPGGLSLVAAAQLLATLAGAGALIGALFFGAGYIAIKQRDTMLGLITTTSKSEYVRTGAVLFPRSINAIVQFLNSGAAFYYWVGAAVVIIATVVFGLLRTNDRFQALATDAEKLVSAKREQSVFVAYGLGILLFFVLFGELTAPLHPINTSLLTSQLRDREVPDSVVAALAQGSDGSEFGLAPGANADGLLLLADSSRIRDQYGPAGDVHVLLHRPQNELDLLTEYGKYCMWIVLCAYGALLIRKLRWAGSPTVGFWTIASDWLVRPIFLVMLMLFGVSLPALYGVLGIPQTFPCVSGIQLAGEDGLSLPGGRLLTDVSSEVGQVVLYRWRSDGYELRFADRAQLSVVTGTACTPANPLGLKPMDRARGSDIVTGDIIEDMPETMSEDIQAPSNP